jgi:hypothetical protein
MLHDIFDADPAEKVRTWDLGNNKIHAKRTNPYGFVSIKFEKGLMPEELKGQFTEFLYAEQAVEAYLSKKGKAVEEK